MSEFGNQLEQALCAARKADPQVTVIREHRDLGLTEESYAVAVVCTPDHYREMQCKVQQLEAALQDTEYQDNIVEKISRMVRDAGNDAAWNECPSEMVTDLINQRDEANARGDGWRDKFHADTKELERLTLERDSWKAEAEMGRELNERLRAAVDAAGGLCECGHVRVGHRIGHVCVSTNDGIGICSCRGFRPATQPGEGEGKTDEAATDGA